MDREFATFLILASYPLRRLEPSGIPTGSCSGTIVQTGAHRVLLSVSHSVAPDESWAVEVRYDPVKGTELWRVGNMEYVRAIDQAGVRNVDFSFRTVPDELRSYFQRFSDTGFLMSEHERLVLRSDLTAEPKCGCAYGFAGFSGVTTEPRPPTLAHQILGGELQVETGLAFLRTERDFDFFGLRHQHPGHAAYRGCSGAPIISEDGDLVGLVVRGCESDSTILSLPLRFYASAVAAALDSGDAEPCAP
jgi:hypothetical protein